MSGFATRYRLNRDWFDSRFWVVQRRHWWWPFWIETAGLLASKKEALDVIETIQREYRASLPRPLQQEEKMK